MARKNLFRSAYQSLVRSRERQARTYAAGVLLGLDDETLSRTGFSRAALARGELRRSDI